MELFQKATRNLFFTGKGGVGKTSLSCAAAITLADAGRRVLLVSTDPASNLDEVLGVGLSARPTPVPGVSGLLALNIDPEEAARVYREKMVAPYRGILPEASIKSIEEQLSGACTIEIAAFDEFAKLLGEPSATTEFDHIIFDTAPTGHTLRLMELPSAWSGFLETNTSGTSCLGPLAGLKAQQALYKATLLALADPSQTTIFLVSRPELAALKEAERTRGELSDLGVSNQRLLINGLFTSSSTDDPVAVALAERGSTAMTAMPAGLAELPLTTFQLQPFGLVGIEKLRALLGQTATQPPPEFEAIAGCTAAACGISRLVDEIAQKSKGVIMTMGKGGVGKTTIASAIAVELARRGFPVHLSTTDPAAHLDFSLAQIVSGLTVSRIDPEAETKAYSAEVMAAAGQGLDEQGRKLLEEDLRSPCTEEIAVFRAFAKKVDEGKDGFVVLDTAPTGHTLLLLDAAEAYHREVTRTMSDMPEAVRQLLPRLRDQEFTRILIVTLPEATPVHEAARLQADLARAGIRPFAWVINQSLYPLPLTDPVLVSRKAHEVRFINEVREKLSLRTALIAWHPGAGHGLDWLNTIMGGNTE